jgi:lysophospholipase L1-like esterase
LKNSILYISLFLNLLFLVAVFFALNKYGGWNLFWAKINNRGIEKTYFHRKNLFEMLPERDSGIVFLGNSLTAYGEWSELFADARIVNRGIPGDHCDGVRERLGDIIKLNPQQIFLMIGINDLAYHPAEKVVLKYEKLVEALVGEFPNTTIYLQSVFPVNNIVSPTPVDNEEVIVLNNGIKKIAVNYAVNFLDTHSILLDANGNLDAKFTSDGVHLNGHAYLIWRDFLLPHIKEND